MFCQHVSEKVSRFCCVQGGTLIIFAPNNTHGRPTIMPPLKKRTSKKKTQDSSESNLQIVLEGKEEIPEESSVAANEVQMEAIPEESEEASATPPEAISEESPPKISGSGESPDERRLRLCEQNVAMALKRTEHLAEGMQRLVSAMVTPETMSKGLDEVLTPLVEKMQELDKSKSPDLKQMAKVDSVAREVRKEMQILHFDLAALEARLTSLSKSLPDRSIAQPTASAVPQSHRPRSL